MDSIEVTPGRCKLVFSEEEIRSDSHLGLGKYLLVFVMSTLLALKYADLNIYHSDEYSHQLNQPYFHTVGSVSGGAPLDFRYIYDSSLIYKFQKNVPLTMASVDGEMSQQRTGSTGQSPGVKHPQGEQDQ